MSIQDTTGIVMAIAAITGVVLQAAALSPATQPPSDRHGPQKRQPSQRPLKTAANTEDTAHSRMARARRFIRANPLSFVMAIAQGSYLMWVAVSSAPPSRALVVAVAVIVADLHATLILWMLGGGDRTIGKIASGQPLLELAAGRDNGPAE